MDRLDTYLTLWASWMRGRETKLGYPKCASPGRSRTRIQHFDDLAEECDTQAVQTVDGLISSLEPPQECSVHVYHLGAVWRFPGPIEDIYGNARDRLELGLNRWGLP